MPSFMGGALPCPGDRNHTQHKPGRERPAGRTPRRVELWSWCLGAWSISGRL